MKIAMISAFAAAAVFTLSAYAEAPVKVADGMITSNNGMTLYVFDKDTAGSGKSVCNGPCMALWPVLAATAGDAPSGSYTIITRDEGAKQWAYKGKPLYYWSGDKKPGDKTGDGYVNAWHIAKP